MEKPKRFGKVIITHRTGECQAKLLYLPSKKHLQVHSEGAFPVVILHLVFNYPRTACYRFTAIIFDNHRRKFLCRICRLALRRSGWFHRW